MMRINSALIFFGFTLAFVGVAHAQVAEAIDALTRASNTADILKLLGISGVFSPFAFWFLSGQRLKQQGRVYEMQQKLLADEAAIARTQAALKEAELNAYREEMTKVTKGFQWLGVRSDKRITFLEGWMKEHSEDAERRYQQTIREIQKAVTTGDSQRAQLSRDISANQDRMVQALGDRFNDAIARIGRLQVDAINSMQTSMIDTLLQIKDKLPSINIVTPPGAKIETGPLSDPAAGTIADGELSAEED